MMSVAYGLAVDPGKRCAGACLFSLADKRIVAAGYVAGSVDGEGPIAAVETALAILEWVDRQTDLVQASRVDVKRLVVEWPQTYGGRAGSGDANDLFPLAALGGALAFAFAGDADVTHYTPHGWKGSIQKPSKASEPYAVEAKVRSRLSLGELRAVKWTGNAKHNWDVTDGVGLALKFLGRFEKIRSYPRE